MKKQITRFAEEYNRRIEVAINGFCELLSEKGFTREEAIKILNVYKKHKVIKLDENNSRYVVIHGKFWEKSILENALNERN